MKCPTCGYDVTDNDKRCQNCGQEFNAEARPISRQEIENFEGITIDSGESKSEQGYKYREGRDHYDQEQVRPRVYVKQFGTSSLFTTLIIGALIIGFIFLVLPPLLLIGLAIIVVWSIFRMFM